MINTRGREDMGFLFERLTRYHEKKIPYLQATMCYFVHFIAEFLRGQGNRAEPHTLENLIIHRCKRFRLSFDCPFVHASLPQAQYFEK